VGASKLGINEVYRRTLEGITESQQALIDYVYIEEGGFI
jgi:hypothetical protein